MRDYDPVEEDSNGFDDFIESGGQEEILPVATSGAVTNMRLAPPPKVSGWWIFYFLVPPVLCLYQVSNCINPQERREE